MRRSLALVLLLSACRAVPVSPAPSRTSPPAISSTIPSQTATPLPPPPTTAPRASCRTGRGRMVIRALVDSSLPRSIPFRIYLPPCYVEHPGETYPVLYLLHGLASTDAQWDELGADEAAQALIASGQAPPFLIVLPWERLGLDWEQAILEHLVPHVEAVYHAAPEAALRAIGGLSRGAGWAFRLGWGQAGVFGSIGMHSPAVIAPDQFLLPTWIRDLPRGAWPRLWIDIGDHDSLKSAALNLVSELDELGIAYEWHLNPGDHVPEYWTAHVEEYLRWYTQQWPEPDFLRDAEMSSRMPLIPPLPTNDQFPSPSPMEKAG